MKTETLLEPLMERLHFENLCKKVKTFEDAVAHCNKLNIDIEDWLFDVNNARQSKSYAKLVIIIKALNEGWEPNLSNNSQNKYYNYFYMNNGTFSYYNTHCDGSD